MSEKSSIPDSLEIEPPSLIFLADATRAQITLKNIHQNQPLAFKVKTTAPRRYCVRPTFGILQPGSSDEVQVLLNTKESGDSDDRMKDKFQVLSLLLTPEQATLEDLKNVWANASDSEISKRRIKCQFASSSSSIPQSPTFTPTIRTQDSMFSSDIDSPVSPLSSATSTPIKQEITREMNKSVNFALPHLSKEPSALAGELATLREEYNKALFKMNSVATERDTLKREMERLKDALLKEREESVRQRKVASGSSAIAASTPKTASSAKANDSLEAFTSNRLIQFIFVALLFFLLGKLL